MLNAKSVTAALVVAFVSMPVFAGSVVDLTQNNYVTWISKSVCVNDAGELLPVDPYQGCPPNAGIRKIQIGDPLPYANIDQGGFQRSDSYPVYDKLRAPVFMHTFDYSPFGEFNLYDGSDGYDVFKVLNGFVSAVNTRDGGGYGQTFFGAGCSQGDGWRLFPATNFLSVNEQQTVSQISGVYWEQTGQSFPGGCPTRYGSTITTYQWVQGKSFGGVAGRPTKTMDTLMVTHISSNIERFYFTREYGLTRWEAWNEIAPTPAPTPYCSGPQSIVVKDKPYYYADCRDWSATIALQTSKVQPWPLVNANLLQYAHFNQSGFVDHNQVQGYWHRFYPPAGPVLNWSASVSVTGGDNRYGSGTAYLAMNCGSTQCPPPGTQAVYQDIPIEKFCSQCSYLYGVNARREAGDGDLYLALQVVRNGVVVWQDVTGKHLAPDNGFGGYAQADSVVRSSAFVSNVVNLPSLAGMRSPNAFVRFLILPGAPNNFNIVDAYVNPLPTTQTRIGIP
ncbi:MAG: hypothetical protein HOP03_07865 [Lysobacter sp.]|nr:hypothetical protein [Lysobacter sp.]